MRRDRARGLEPTEASKLSCVVSEAPSGYGGWLRLRCSMKCGRGMSTMKCWSGKCWSKPRQQRVTSVLPVEWLKKTHRNPLHKAMEKMKQEMMLLGFISLLLEATSRIISGICIDSKFYNKFSPCTREEVEESINAEHAVAHARKHLIEVILHQCTIESGGTLKLNTIIIKIALRLLLLGSYILIEMALPTLMRIRRDWILSFFGASSSAGILCTLSSSKLISSPLLMKIPRGLIEASLFGAGLSIVALLAMVFYLRCF